MTTWTLTTRLSPATMEKLELLAQGTRRSKSLLAAEAVSIYVERELPIVEGIQRGLEDVKAGRVIPHREAMAEMRRVIAEAKRSQKKKARTSRSE